MDELVEKFLQEENPYCTEEMLTIFTKNVIEKYFANNCDGIYSIPNRRI